MLKIRPQPLVVLLGLTLLLAACQDPPPVLEYEGVTVTDGVEQPLTLAVQRRGDRLVGEYRIRAVAGAFRGQAAGEAVTADLIPAPDCAYTFEGTLTGTSLTGVFQPTACPGGKAGTWALELR